MRGLKSALELLSDIGGKAYDLQHHSEGEIAEAMAFMRAASNGPMFDWLVRVLSAGLPSVGESTSESDRALRRRVEQLIQEFRSYARTSESSGYQYGKGAADSWDAAADRLTAILAVSARTCTEEKEEKVTRVADQRPRATPSPDSVRQPQEETKEV